MAIEDFLDGGHSPPQKWLEGKFPSGLHYRLAKKLSSALHQDTRSDYEALLDKHPNISSYLSSQKLPNFMEMDELSKIEFMQPFLMVLLKAPALHEILGGLRGLIESHKYEIIREEGQTGFERTQKLIEEKLADEKDRYAFDSEKNEQRMSRIIDSIQKRIGFYAKAADYAMVNAESKDLRLLQRAVKRKGFREEIIRFMHPDYESAAEAELDTFLINLRQYEIAHTNQPQMPEPSSMRNFLLDLYNMRLERLKRIHTPVQSI